MTVSRSLLLAIILIAVLPQPAHAMRCGRDLISVGDSSIEVRRLCGEPSDITSHEEQTVFGIQDRVTGAYIEKTRTEIIAEWTYNFGPKRLMRVLRFNNGRVVDIQSLDYGF